VIDRWGVLRTNIMNGERVLARIDEIASLLTDGGAPTSPVTRNFAKYPNYIGAYHWPNPPGSGGAVNSWHVNYWVGISNYSQIIAQMKKWTWGRYLWIDGQFPKAPSLSVPEGDITAGSSVVMIAPAGTIYYTLDGSDPRASQAGGAVAPGALTYTGAIVLNNNARVFARARVGTTWSPPAIATYVVQRPRLVITEIMYHPLPPNPGPGVTNIDEDFEYIEVKNIGGTPLNVNGFTISGGIDFVFPNRTLAVAERAVVVKSRYAFTNRYGASLNAAVAGEYTGNLANDGNRLVLEGRVREPILDFSYDDDWYPITDGFGFSLVVVDENAAASAWAQRAVATQCVLNGTPGQADGAAPAFRKSSLTKP
jgi:hypothetical protein